MKAAFTRLTVSILEEHHVPNPKQISDKLWTAQLDQQGKSTAPKKRSGKSNWKKWMEKRKVEAQEVESAAEAKPVKRLVIKKKAP